MNRKKLAKQALEGKQYLRFDNLNFKIAVLQHLIYEKKVLDLPQDFPVYEEDLEEDYLYHASFYIASWRIPAYFAKNVTDLFITPQNDIYELLDPMAIAEPEQFEINQISDREINQFSVLKAISLYYMSTNVEQLTAQMKKNGVAIKSGRREEGKSVSMLGAVIFLLCFAMISGVFMGRVFFQRYGHIGVEIITKQQQDTKDNTVMEEETEQDTVVEEAAEQGDNDSSDEIIDSTMEETTEQIRELRKKLEEMTE